MLLQAPAKTLQALLQILTKASTNTVSSVVANAVNRKMFQSSLQIHNSSIIANSLITRKQALLQLSANTVAVNDANTVTSESRRFLSKSKLTPLTFDWGGCLCSDTFQGMWLWRWSSLDIWTNSMNLIKKDRVYWRSELPCIWLPWFPISPSGFIELKIRISGFNCQSAVLSFFLFSLNLRANCTCLWWCWWGWRLEIFLAPQVL